MNQEINATEEVKVQSVVIPKNWLKNRQDKPMGFLHWMAYHIKSEEYTNDLGMSDALLKLN